MYGSAKEGQDWILYLGGIIACLGITLTTTCRSLVTKVPCYKNEKKNILRSIIIIKLSTLLVCWSIRSRKNL